MRTESPIVELKEKVQRLEIALRRLIILLFSKQILTREMLNNKISEIAIICGLDVRQLELLDGPSFHDDLSRNI